MKSTPKPSFITTTNDKPRFHYHQHHQQPHKKSKRMHRKPTTTTKNPNPPTTLNHNHNLPQKIQTNVQTTSTTAQTSLTTTKNPNPPTRKCIANPNHKHSKPKLRILRSETQITKLGIEMNWSGKRDEREKKCLREKPICKRRKESEKKKKRRPDLGWACGCSWWLLMMVTIWQKGWERENEGPI